MRQVSWVAFFVAILLAGVAVAWDGPQQVLSPGGLQDEGAPVPPLVPGEQLIAIIKLADAGDAVAQTALGYAHEQGTFGAPNYARALQWYTRAAEQGNIFAAVHLGNMYATGMGTPRDSQKAAHWYRSVARRSEFARRRLSEVLSLTQQPRAAGGGSVAPRGTTLPATHGTAGAGVPEPTATAPPDRNLESARLPASASLPVRAPDNDRARVMSDPHAFRWYLNAAQRGIVDAQFSLGSIYLEGRGVPKNAGEAAKWYRRAAEQGHARAQTSLGLLYLEGLGVRKDKTKAGMWFRESAGKVGTTQVHGDTVAVGDADVVKWLRVAADHGVLEAQYALGTLYANGDGIAKDEAAAVQWLQRAADNGFARAQLALGQLMIAIGGQQPAGGEAARWIESAAQSGLPDAQLALARMFRDGMGVRRDGAEAGKWFREVSGQGWAEAQYALGEMYRDANSVPRDAVLAYAWFALAGSNGDRRALNAINEIAPLMTMAQIAAAQKQAYALASQMAEKKAQR